MRILLLNCPHYRELDDVSAIINAGSLDKFAAVRSLNNLINSLLMPIFRLTTMEAIEELEANGQFHLITPSLVENLTQSLPHQQRKVRTAAVRALGN